MFFKKYFYLCENATAFKAAAFYSYLILIIESSVGCSFF